MSVRVLSWVFDHSTVENRSDLLVLLVLADHAHDDGTHAFPSVATIGRKARLSRRGSQEALRRLRDTGTIVAAGFGSNGATSYRVVMDAEGGAVTARGGAETDKGGRTSSAPHNRPLTVNTSLSPNVAEIRGEREGGELIKFNPRSLVRLRKVGS